MASSSAGSNSPCAACKFLRRKCTQGCVFAPYFPPDQPAKFANVHRVFGASNVAKLLNELHPVQREDAVNSLAYEAEARLRDPVYGCVGYISILQHKLKQVQNDLYNAKKELSAYLGPSAGAMPPHFLTAATLMSPHHLQLQHQQHQQQQYSITAAVAAAHHGASSSMSTVPYGISSPAATDLGLPPSGSSSSVMTLEQQYYQQKIMEAQQLAAAAARKQEMLLRSCGQPRHGGAFDGREGIGFDQMGDVVSVAGPAHSGLGMVPQEPFDDPFQMQQQQLHQSQQQHLQQQQQQNQQHRRNGSDEGRSGGGAGPGLSS